MMINTAVGDESVIATIIKNHEPPGKETGSRLKT